MNYIINGEEVTEQDALERLNTLQPFETLDIQVKEAVSPKAPRRDLDED